MLGTTLAMRMHLQLARSRREDRLAPGLDASPLFERELECRRRRVAHPDFELKLLTSRALAHERGRFPSRSIH